jgi:hypothetical protein
VCVIAKRLADTLDVIQQPDLTAHELCEPLFKPILFNFGKPPTPERIRYVVGIAVKAFLAAYKVNNLTARRV